MAVSDFRIQLDFFDHPKAIRLEARLGAAGVVALWRLWGWCAKRRTDGDLAGLSDADVELAARWSGDPGAFIEVLLSIRFLDRNNDGLSIHGWSESQPWVVGAARRSKKAKKAGKRSGEIRQYELELTSTRSTTGSPSRSTPSPSPSPVPTPTPSPVPTPVSTPVGVNHGFNSFVAAFDALFREANAGAKPTWGPTQGAMVKGILVKHGLEECVRRARRMFESPPAWIAKGGGSLSLKTLVANFDAFAGDASGSALPAGRTNAAGERALSATEILAMRTPEGGSS